MSVAFETPFSERIGELGAAAGWTARTLDAQARHVTDPKRTAVDCIKESPLAAVGVALGGGMVIGALVALAARRATVIDVPVSTAAEDVVDDECC